MGPHRHRCQPGARGRRVPHAGPPGGATRQLEHLGRAADGPARDVRRPLLCRGGQPLRRHGWRGALRARGIRPLRGVRGGLDALGSTPYELGVGGQRPRRCARLLLAGAWCGLVAAGVHHRARPHPDGHQHPRHQAECDRGQRADRGETRAAGPLHPDRPAARRVGIADARRTHPVAPDRGASALPDLRVRRIRSRTRAPPAKRRTRGARCRSR